MRNERRVNDRRMAANRSASPWNHTNKADDCSRRQKTREYLQRKKKKVMKSIPLEQFQIHSSRSEQKPTRRKWRGVGYQTTSFACGLYKNERDRWSAKEEQLNQRAAVGEPPRNNRRSQSSTCESSHRCVVVRDEKTNKRQRRATNDDRERARDGAPSIINSRDSTAST